ncbi:MULTISPECIES: hypothetical protein [Clostridium]|uniref:hypothetical protein n=1 Tax=Clostridium TaxID=1485 RepID=UPI0025BA1214|nr:MULTISPECIES: hypothetical protein [Clostridium]MDU3299283.1 hypothetical protein [Clostridioides difficile]MDU4912709.1 hypothetical protein [Clostridium baratii]
MGIKKGLILAAALAMTNIGSLCTVANAATYVEQNGISYVTEWENYDYAYGFEGSVTLKDYWGNPATFGRNIAGEWVSDPLTVTSSKFYGYYLKYFNFEFNYDNVQVYDYQTRKEITNGFLKNGQKIYIVSKYDPMNLRIKFTPILIAEN